MNELPLKHLKGPLWFAGRKAFQFPGFYYLTVGGPVRVIPLPPLAKEPELIEFPEQTIVIAKDQPQYRPLPAFRQPDDPSGKIVCCWKLSLANRLRVLFTGKLWHSILTFNQPLQPQLLLVRKPDMSAPSSTK